ncbi:MAG: MFS transporter [Chloroflexi bacterium]|nr:MFS transporter [Chloroflexota bacterium]
MFLLISLVLATYFGNGSAIAMTPFLLDIARDLNADLSAMGVLLAASSVTWGTVSLFAGAISDRLGRRPVLLVGLAGLALSPLGLAASTVVPVAFVARVIGGFGGGAFMGTAFAAASDAFPTAERGRALGWMITGQSISLVLGVPLVAYLASFVGWRGALAFQGMAVLLAALLVWLTVPGLPARARAAAAAGPSVWSLMTPRVLALLTANSMERFCYGGVAVYLATYLTTSYGVSLEVLAVGLGLVALGNLCGNFVGGELSDRLRSRTALSAVSLLVTGLLALPLLLWQPGLWVSVAFGFVYTVANAIGRPSLMAGVSEVSNEARGALLGVNMTFASFGWLGSQAVGGWIITTMGFPVFGAITAACGVVGALMAVAGRMPSREAAQGPA